MNYECEYTHVHTSLSNTLIGFPDSPASQEDYAKRMKEFGSQCLLFTEHGHRSDVWQTADLGAKYGMKPLCGAEAYFVPDRKADDGRNFHMIVLAKDNDAFRQLNFALSEAWTTGFYRRARLDFELLEALDPDKFLITTACLGGILKDPEGEKYAERLAAMFPHSFYLEVQPHLVDDQIQLNKRIVELANSHNWPLILGTDSHYVNKEDKMIRTELINSVKNKKTAATTKQAVPMALSHDDEFDLYLPSPDEVVQLLKAQGALNRAEIEESLENTLQIREWPGFSYDGSRKFPITRLDMTDDERKKRYIKTVHDNYVEQFGKPTKEEAAELNAEVKMICDTKSYDYFLSLYDMMEKGKELGGILTKTSRGSAASFATSAALKFTSINRLHEQVRLYPDRFVSRAKLANAMPD